jgi:Tfp pilus assembly protein FimT
MAILISLATPVFTGTIGVHKLKADARQMACVLKTAREKAIMSSEAQSVIFYTESTKYKFAGEATYWLNSGISYAGTSTFSGDTGRKKCTFSPSGAPDSGGTVVLKNRSNDKLYIIVNPVAGRVRVSERPPANW